MKKLKKKSFIKTVEILLVIIITTIFSLSLMQRQSLVSNNEPKNYLVNLEKNSFFREFVINNEGCFNETEFIPDSSVLCINSQPVFEKKPIYAETLFFTGNETKLNFKIVALYKK